MLLSCAGWNRRTGRTHLQDADDLVDDHEDPDHSDEKAQEAQDDPTRVPRAVEVPKGEEREDAAGGESDDGLPPPHVLGCVRAGCRKSQ